MRSAFSADLDGDGDMDALSSSDEQQIAWYENTDGDGTYGEQIVIENGVGVTNLSTCC